MHRSVMTDRLMVVIGGNAFVRAGVPLTMAGQFEFARSALSTLRPLLESAQPMVLTHGNGPQVGQMLARVEASLGAAYAVPLEVCVAETEGELGYVLEQTLYNLLAEWRVARPIVSLLTQVVVDADDPAFEHPTKPIGPWYTAERAAQLVAQGFRVVEDSGRGYRRVVPSPAPLDVVELDVIRRLLEGGVLAICGGGGGIPVVRDQGGLRGIEAVIDKDLTSALLGVALGARAMVILTGVPCVYRNFGTDRQQPLPWLGLAEVRGLLAAGEFAPGSMHPKMEAAAQFLEGAGHGAQVLICDPPSLGEALQGRAGTWIDRDGPPGEHR